MHIMVCMNKQTIARITTNIDARLLKFVDGLAKEQNVSRRDIIEESIKKIERDIKGKAITEAYNKMAEDREEMDMWLAIANHPANLKW